MTWMTCKGLSVRIISTRAGGDRGHIRQASTFRTTKGTYGLLEIFGRSSGPNDQDRLRLLSEWRRLATKLKC